MSRRGVSVLARQWENSGKRLRQRCQDLTDAELRWEPVEGAWNLHPDPDHPGGWSYPYDFDPPRPHPVTTIGWRLVHLTGCNWIYLEHAFGPGERNFTDLAVYGTALEVLGEWESSRLAVTEWLRAADDVDLGETRPTHLGMSLQAGEVMRILIDEQTHHGGEIGLLRDLYLRSPTR